MILHFMTRKGRDIVWSSLNSFGARAHRPLHKRTMILIRVLWVLIVLLTVAMFGAALSYRFDQLLTDVSIYGGALQQLGLTTKFLAFYSLLPEMGVMLVFLLLGTLLFWRHCEDWVSIFMSLTLVMLGVLFTPTLGALEEQPFWGALVVPVRTFSILVSLIFLYLFPDGRFVPRWTRYLGLVWGVAWVSICCVPLSLFDSLGFRVVQGGLYVIGYGSGIVAQSYRHFFVSEQQERVQTRWVVAGAIATVLLSFATFAAHTGLSFLLSGGVWGVVYTLLGAPALTYLPVIVVIFSLGISIWRYRLWDLDLLIYRGVLYGTLMVILGIVYYVLVFVLTLLVRNLFDWGSDTLVVFAASVTIALAFNPLRQRVRLFIDRAFYPSKIDLQQLLPGLSARIATSIVLQNLTTLLTEELPRELQISDASLMVLDAEEACLAPAGAYGDRCALSLEHPLAVYLAALGEPIVVARPPFDLPREAVALLEAQEVALSIPLLLGRRLVGLYNVGPRTSGISYSREEVEMLALLGRQAALSVENARLYRQVEVYSQTLEQQVEARTQALESANRELRAQHAELDIILHNMADGLVVTDLEGRIEIANTVFTTTVGQSEEGLIGRSLQDVWPDDVLAQSTQGALQAPGTIVSVDTVHGKRVFQASSCTLGAGPDTLLGVVTVMRDITERVHAIQMKQEFVSMVSHELRTPMTSVLGFGKLIKRQFNGRIVPRLPAGDPEGERAVRRIRDNLEIIETEGERLTRLINDVLDVSKMESEHMQWEMEHVHLCETIAQSVAMMQSQARQKGVMLDLEMEDTLPVVWADRDRLIQVITNMVSNAIKFTDEGKVCVHAWSVPSGTGLPPLYPRQRDAQTGLPAAEPYVAVSVVDTGIGIAEADMPEIFEKFRQVGPRRLGTGLGLSICKEIVQHHGGRIWAESRLGEGSRFVFTLPAGNGGRPAGP